MASPLTHEAILEAPAPGVKDIDGPVAYWSALLHLLVYGLGWVRPDRGMKWWYDSGKPTVDRTLRFVTRVWEADGQLDWFAAWLWSTPSLLSPELVSDATGYALAAHSPLPADDRWLRARRTEADASGVSAPVSHGGGDPHHLQDHIAGPLQDVTGKALLLRTSAADRRAVLFLDSMVGWYRALATTSRSLPKLSAHSWRVDVVVKPVGWLGTYRKSAESGLWFTGHHSVHIQGV